MPMQGGVMVGKTQAQKALRALEGKAEAPKAVMPLSVGTAPGDAELVTIKDGVVHIGKHEAVNFDTGEPVRVRSGASDEEIKQALKDAGSLSKRQKVFGASPRRSQFDDPEYLAQNEQVNAELKANREKDAGYTVADDVGAALRKLGAESTSTIKETEWEMKVPPGNLSDVVITFDPATHRATVKAQYMGRTMDERTADGAAAITEAVERARDGLAKGVWRMVHQRMAESGLPQPKHDLLGKAPNDSQQAASKLKGEQAEREQRQQQAAPDDFKLTGSDRSADADPDQQGLLRRGDGTFVSPATVKQVHGIVDAATAKWKSGPPVHVVGTYRELPQDQPPGTRGLYYKGHVWIAAHEHADAADVAGAVARTLAHEAVAHYGLREMLGRDRWTQLMRQIDLAAASGNKPIREIRDLVRATYRNKDGSYAFDKRPALEADEIAARAIERAIDDNGNFRPGFGFLKAAWSHVAEFLRSVGINVKFSDAELQGMLVRSMAGLEAGHRTEGGGELAVAAARDDPAMQSRALREEGLPEGIPHIASARNTHALKAHPDYASAKAGDAEAAARLVRELVPETDIATARDKFGADAIYTAPMAEEATGKNAIPKTVAARYAAATGGHVDNEIVQANRAYHTGADPMERMISRPVFDGEVKAGGRYVLVDDVSTMGATLAELADHIRAGGGKVVGTVLLANTSRADTMNPTRTQVRKIEERYGDQVRQLFNAEPAALTAAEAGYVLNHRDASELANRAAKAARERDNRLRAKGVLPSQPAEGVKPPDDFAPDKGVQARTAAADDERTFTPKPPGRPMFEGAGDFARNMLREGQMFAAPMGAGSEKARAIAQRFANDIRVARTQWHRIDDFISKNFTEEQRKLMWDAADEENVERQRVDQDPAYKRPADTGLARLSPEERAAVERLHTYGEEMLQRARDAGMFKGEGLPYWTPRMAVMIGDDGEFGRIPAGDGPQADNDGRGRNVTTTASSLKQRKYLTASETERAASELAKAKGGQGAQLVRDIRTMPMAMARLERAIAGRELINQVKEIGLAAGRETTSTTGGPGFFTLDHPAFKEYRYRPDVAMAEARDKHLWGALEHFAQDIGVSHERVEKLRGRTWGFATTAGDVVTRFGGPETVLTHELGHQLDFKYGLADTLTKRGATAKELRALADLRFEGSETSEYFKRYVRRGTEKIANMVHAYVHMPDRFKEVAPVTFKAFNDFLDAHPELAGLRKIKPSLVLESNRTSKRPPGEDFDVLPLYISKDFEGPLRAVMSNQDGEIYKGYMLLKSKSMSAIMFSPLIHNMVIWGRALAYSPTKVGSTYLYWKGSALERDNEFVRQAVKDGVVPIGFNKTTAMDAVDLAGRVEKLGRWGDPNESWVNLSMQKAGNWIHEGMGDKTKAGLDAAGDFWHHTLLWKQIQNLQWGIYADAKQTLHGQGHERGSRGHAGRALRQSIRRRRRRGELGRVRAQGDEHPAVLAQLQHHEHRRVARHALRPARWLEGEVVRERSESRGRSRGVDRKAQGGQRARAGLRLRDHRHLARAGPGRQVARRERRRGDRARLHRSPAGNGSGYQGPSARRGQLQPVSPCIDLPQRAGQEEPRGLRRRRRRSPPVHAPAHRQGDRGRHRLGAASGRHVLGEDGAMAEGRVAGAAGRQGLRSAGARPERDLVQGVVGIGRACDRQPDARRRHQGALQRGARYRRRPRQEEARWQRDGLHLQPGPPRRAGSRSGGTHERSLREVEEVHDAARQGRPQTRRRGRGSGEDGEDRHEQQRDQRRTVARRESEVGPVEGGAQALRAARERRRAARDGDPVGPLTAARGYWPRSGAPSMPAGHCRDVVRYSRSRHRKQVCRSTNPPRVTCTGISSTRSSPSSKRCTRTSGFAVMSTCARRGASLGGTAASLQAARTRQAARMGRTGEV
jgi:hypothetical protein